MMKKDKVFEIAGWLGTGVILLSYFLLSTGVISNDWRYHFMVLVGSVGVAIISYVKRAWQPFFLNSVFCVLALFAIFNSY